MPFIFMKFLSDIGQCFRTAKTKSLKDQKSGHVWIIYLLLLVDISGLWCRLQMRYRLQAADRIPKSPTDRNFLELPETLICKKKKSILCKNIGEP